MPAGNLEHTKLITTLLNAQWVEVSLMPELKLFVPCYPGRRLTFRKHCAIHLFAYIFILVTHLLQTCNDMHAVNTHICFLIRVQFSCFVKYFDDYCIICHFTNTHTLSQCFNFVVIKNKGKKSCCSSCNNNVITYL